MKICINNYLFGCFCRAWFCPVVSEPVEPYFIKFLRALSFCLGALNGVVFCRNDVVNGVVEYKIKFIIEEKEAGAR